MYFVHCAIYTIYYIIHRTLYCVYCRLFMYLINIFGLIQMNILLCTMKFAHRALYTFYTVHYTLYIIICTVYYVHCTIYTVYILLLLLLLLLHNTTTRYLLYLGTQVPTTSTYCTLSTQSTPLNWWANKPTSSVTN